VKGKRKDQLPEAEGIRTNVEDDGRRKGERHSINSVASKGGVG